MSDPGPRPECQCVAAVPCRSYPGTVPLALAPPSTGAPARVSPRVFLAAPGDSVGRVCAFNAQGQAVLGQTSVPWEGAGLCPGIIIPSAWQCSSWTALSCMALAPGMLRITQVSSHLALAGIHPALGTLPLLGLSHLPYYAEQALAGGFVLFLPTSVKNVFS